LIKHEKQKNNYEVVRKYCVSEAKPLKAEIIGTQIKEHVNIIISFDVRC
jgi:hypothetical protein